MEQKIKEVFQRLEEAERKKQEIGIAIEFLDVLAIIREINQQLFSYAFMNIADCEELIMKRVCNTVDRKTVEKAVTEWAETVRRICYIRQLHIVDNRLIMDFMEEREDLFYIACTNGLGDTLYTAAFVKAFKECHNIPKVCLILKDTHKEMAGWFEGIDEVIVSSTLVKAFEEWSISNQVWRLDNYLFGHVPKDVCKREYLVSDPRALAKFKGLIFDIPNELPLEKPRFDYGNRDRLKEKYQLDKKTVILMPYAESSFALPEIFWELLARQFTENGYKLYTNVKDKEQKAVPLTEPMAESVNDTAVAAEECLAVMGLRSGLCDIVALTDVILFTFDTELEFYKNWNLAEITGKDSVFAYYCSNEGELKKAYADICYAFNMKL